MWIPDPFLGRIESVTTSPLAGLPRFGDWFLKAKDTTINEVAAYQFAAQVGVDLPESRWFMIRKPFELKSCRLGPGDVAMLIKPLQVPEGEQAERLIRIHGAAVARVAALWCFFRHEFGEIWPTRERLYVFDLEFAFARVEPTAEGRVRQLEYFLSCTDEVLTCAVDLADRYSVVPEFYAELRAMCNHALSDRCTFDFEPVRRRKTIEQFLLNSLRRRARLAIELLRL